MGRRSLRFGFASVGSSARVYSFTALRRCGTRSCMKEENLCGDFHAERFVYLLVLLRTTVQYST
jgi:hypothetical protein